VGWQYKLANEDLFAAISLGWGKPPPAKARLRSAALLLV